MMRSHIFIPSWSPQPPNASKEGEHAEEGGDEKVIITGSKEAVEKLKARVHFFMSGLAPQDPLSYIQPFISQTGQPKPGEAGEGREVPQEAQRLLQLVEKLSSSSAQKQAPPPPAQMNHQQSDMLSSMPGQQLEFQRGKSSSPRVKSGFPPYRRGFQQERARYQDDSKLSSNVAYEQYPEFATPSQEMSMKLIEPQLPSSRQSPAAPRIAGLPYGDIPSQYSQRLYGSDAIPAPPKSFHPPAAIDDPLGRGGAGQLHEESYRAGGDLAGRRFEASDVEKRFSLSSMHPSLPPKEFSFGRGEQIRPAEDVTMLRSRSATYMPQQELQREAFSSSKAPSSQLVDQEALQVMSWKLDHVTQGLNVVTKAIDHLSSSLPHSKHLDEKEILLASDKHPHESSYRQQVLIVYR
eukprot:761519-Hanusia_phi.AAC.3